MEGTPGCFCKKLKEGQFAKWVCSRKPKGVEIRQTHVLPVAICTAKKVCDTFTVFLNAFTEQFIIADVVIIIAILLVLIYSL